MGISLDEAIGVQIKLARQDRSLSQNSLASLSGLTRAHLAKIERGEVSATIRTIERISHELGMPLSELIGEAEEAIDDK